MCSVILASTCTSILLLSRADQTASVLAGNTIKSILSKLSIGMDCKLKQEIQIYLELSTYNLMKTKHYLYYYINFSFYSPGDDLFELLKPIFMYSVQYNISEQTNTNVFLFQILLETNTFMIQNFAQMICKFMRAPHAML